MVGTGPNRPGSIYRRRATNRRELSAVQVVSPARSSAKQKQQQQRPGWQTQEVNKHGTIAYGGTIYLSRNYLSDRFWRNGRERQRKTARNEECDGHFLVWPHGVVVVVVGAEWEAPVGPDGLPRLTWHTWIGFMMVPLETLNM